ncbi:hypothetical protein [Nocardiopsis halotolerans]|uniref:hypothetical protein n=1 Tax=Nocardiopsis halotolerans TaxID=124252 RepID=UPI00034DF0AC|nr:hypothetical protein [Nocardiopsis halotolerans]
MNTLLTSATVLAGQVSLDKDTVTPGVLGFLMIFAVGVGLYFLMRSLMGKLRALPKDGDFGTRSEADGGGTGSGTGAVVGASAEDDTPRT